MEREIVLLRDGQRIAMLQGEIAVGAFPLDTDRARLAGLHVEPEVAIPRVPVLPPRVDDGRAIDAELLIIARVERELVRAGRQRFDLALEYDLRLHALE